MNIPPTNRGDAGGRDVDIPRRRVTGSVMTSARRRYTWVGLALFPRGTAQGDEVFTSPSETYWQLTVLATTANFPDVAQRAYAANRLSMLYFGTFMGLCVLLLMNVVLAVVSDAYMKRAADEKATMIDARTENIGHAYKLLSRDGPATRDDVRALCYELDRTFHLVPPLTKDMEAVLFGVLRSRTQDAVDADEFGKIVDLLRLRLTKLQGGPVEGTERRGDSVETSRGDAAAATWILRGDESRRRRGCRADRPRGRRADEAREERSTDSIGSGRLRRGWDAYSPRRRVAATPTW